MSTLRVPHASPATRSTRFTAAQPVRSGESDRYQTHDLPHNVMTLGACAKLSRAGKNLDSGPGDLENETAANSSKLKAGTTDTVRLNININDQVADALRQMSKKRRVSVTEIIRRAVSMLFFIEKEVEAGSTLQVVSKDGHIREIVLI